MRTVKTKPSRGGGVLLLALALALGGACGDKKKTEGKSSETGTETTADPKDHVGAQTPNLTAMDVSILVDPCIEGGIPEEACKCAGEEAKTMIGAELLAKMAKAPADDDPELAEYYSAPEMQRVMKWVDGAAIKCGIEEEE